MPIGAARGAPIAQGAPTIVLHVDDYAALPRKLLLGVEALANGIFRSAGVDTRWVNRTMPREQRVDDPVFAGQVGDHGIHLRVIILPDKMTERKLRGSPHGSHVIGLAQPAPELSDSVAFVFFGRLERAADRYAKAPSDLLAHVMAHEVGHLLLPHGSHSNTGIMLETWDPQQLSAPVFTAAQAALIRSTLLAARASELR